MVASRRSYRLPRLFLLLLVLSGVRAQAQYSGNIQGVVSDPTGAAVNGGSIQLFNVDTGVTANTRTSDSGNYRFSSLQPGRYVVTAEASGFSKTEIRVTLGTGETQGINFRLTLGSATQAVNVNAEAPVLDTDESRLQATLPSSQVRDLPS